MIVAILSVTYENVKHLPVSDHFEWIILHSSVFLSSSASKLASIFIYGGKKIILVFYFFIFLILI